MRLRRVIAAEFGKICETQKLQNAFKRKMKCPVHARCFRKKQHDHHYKEAISAKQVN